MEELTTQAQRLDFLVDAFKADSAEYKDLETPRDEDGKRTLLRSLMNIRMPRQVPDDVLRVQDAYLSVRAQELADCYRNTLELCRENGLKSVAFCCISTGVFRFPNQCAAEIAVHTVDQWMAAHPGAVERVVFNVFKDGDKVYYEKLLR